MDRVPGAFMNSASPVSGALLVFCVNQGISASFSLFYFLIIDSRPQGSGPLKDLSTKDFDCVNHNKLWEILKEMGTPDHLTCLLRNLYAGQEATVRTGHGTTDWFQIGKGVPQSCILLPCLFNLYGEYIMRNAGLEEAPGEISITSNMQMTSPL